MSVASVFKHLCRSVGFCWLLLFWALPVCQSVVAAEIRYSADVAPLLSKYCLGCHQRSEAEAGLSLQTPAEILKGGESGPAIDASQLQNSHLLRVLRSDGDDRMPPSDQPQPTAAERSLL